MKIMKAKSGRNGEGVSASAKLKAAWRHHGIWRKANVGGMATGSGKNIIEKKMKAAKAMALAAKISSNGSAKRRK
jgi:hypothetical protein